MMQSAPLLCARGLSVRFGAHQILKSVDVELGSNEILGIIGPNGAGKTTLLECLAGLLPGDAGELTMLGSRPSPQLRRRALSYLPDVLSPWGEHPVGHLIGLYRDLHATPASAAVALLRRLRLEPVLRTRTRDLSKGYRRRFLLCLALLTSQPILLLDEPFDGLDLRQTAAAMELLREATTTRALILSIHQLADAARICDRLLLLDGGRRVGCGTMSELRNQAGLEAGTLEEVFLAVTR